MEKERLVKEQVVSPLQALEELDKEITLLVDEKQKIINSQKNLLFILNKRIETKKRNNEKLKLEIEKLKATCAKMARIINASIRFNADNRAFISAS
jgi:septal ring factor EnvC (AmiA/AmiB activator)